MSIVIEHNVEFHYPYRTQYVKAYLITTSMLHSVNALPVHRGGKQLSSSALMSYHGNPKGCEGDLTAPGASFAPRTVDKRTLQNGNHRAPKRNESNAGERQAFIYASVHDLTTCANSQSRHFHLFIPFPKRTPQDQPPGV